MRDLIEGIKSLDERFVWKGPLVSIIDKSGDAISDMEADVRRALKDYDIATSYPGPGKSKAEAVRSAATALADILDKAHAALADVLDAEREFVQEFGPADEYIAARRKSIFPR